MVGIFGAHPFDVHVERQVDKHCSQPAWYCDKCGWEGDDDDAVCFNSDDYRCPECDTKLDM